MENSIVNGIETMESDPYFKMTKLIIVRHGQSIANLEHWFAERIRGSCKAHKRPRWKTV